jgi:GT2 family glycosyltransferase
MTIIKIGILIPVFNNLAFTRKSLTKLYEVISIPASLDIQIIVSDDGSTDGTADWINNNYPKTHLLNGDGNLWWSGGINLGMKYAIETLTCDYVLWWNNDIIPAEDYFIELEKIILTDKPMMAGSKIFYAHEPDLVWSMGGIFDTRGGMKYMRGMNQKDNAKLNEVVDADWLPGMGTLLHNEVVQKIGWLDEKNFPQYHGDSDYTYRGRLSGIEIKVFPQLKIWNDKSNSGLLHHDSYKLLIRTLTDIKSNYHIGKDVLFYRKYATSMRAYQTLVSKYCFYIGGFAKWKLLNLFGVRKKRKSL